MSGVVPPSASGNNDAESEEHADLVCGICFTEMDPLSNPRGVLNSCNHIFCTYCISAWSASSNHCPHCKQRYTRVHSTTLVPVEGGDQGNKPQGRYEQLGGGEPQNKMAMITTAPQEVLDYAIARLPKSSSAAKKKTPAGQAAFIDLSALELPPIVVGGPDGAAVRYYALLEEKKIRRKNYRHEDDDDSDDEGEDDEDLGGDEQNEQWMTSLLDDEEATAPPLTASRRRSSTTRCGGGRGPRPEEEDEEGLALLLGSGDSDALLDRDNSAPPPDCSPTSVPAAPNTGTPQRANPRAGRAAAASLIIRCAICSAPIGGGSSMVSCKESSCPFIAHANCVGSGAVAVGWMMIDGNTYHCPEHPPSCESDSTSAAATRRAQTAGGAAQQPPRRQRAVGVPAVEQPKPFDLGGGDGFMKLPDMPTGTMGTGDAIKQTVNWTRGQGDGGNIDHLNSQRVGGLHDLQGRRDLQQRSSALRIQTQASMATVTLGGGQLNAGGKRPQAKLIDAQPVMVMQGGHSSGSGTSVALEALANRGMVNPSTIGRVVGQKSGRGPVQKEEDVAKVQSLESIEAEVYREELASLRDLERHGKQYRAGGDMRFRANIWDPFTGKLVIPPPETAADRAAAVEADKQQAERVDAHLKERAKAAAKAYVSQVEKHRVSHEEKKEAQKLSRERAALLKLQMLIATRHREFLEKKKDQMEKDQIEMVKQQQQEREKMHRQSQKKKAPPLVAKRD